jgi:hypothetical protein
MPPSDASHESARRKTRRRIPAGDCVEVALSDGKVAMRDLKHPDGPVLMYSTAEWRRFVDRVKHGEFDGLCEKKSQKATKRTLHRREPGWAVSGHGEQEPGNHHDAAPNVRYSTTYRPRDESPPKNFVDSFDRHISRATEKDDFERRYISLLENAGSIVSSVIRAITRLIIIAMVCAFLLLALGVAAAVYVGVPPLIAISVGTGGTAAFVLTVAFRCLHVLEAAHGRLAPKDQADSGASGEVAD